MKLNTQSRPVIINMHKKLVIYAQEGYAYGYIIYLDLFISVLLIKTESELVMWM